MRTFDRAAFQTVRVYESGGRALVFRALLSQPTYDERYRSAESMPDRGRRP